MGNYTQIWFEICDMIKRNESDVGDVVFEILANKNSVQISLFYIVFSIVKSFITP